MAIVINGSGTVTGLAVGGLPDGTVDAGTLATDSVDSAEIVDGSVDRSKLNTSIADSGNATAITINATENVGVGVVPEAWNSVYDAIQIGNTASIAGYTGGDVDRVWVTANGYVNTTDGLWQYINTDTASQYEQRDGIHNFFVAPSGTADATISWTNAMKIINNGSIIIGNNGTWSASEDVMLIESNGLLDIARNDTGNQSAIAFYNPNGQVGKITVSGSATAYNTSSDYRLKENVDYDWDATTRLKQLKPARFNFIADDTNTVVDGFIAHEAATVVPECVSGTKDAMRDEEYEVTPAVMDGETVVTEAVMGTRSVPDMQGIDQSKLVPLLVKTIQELEARITALEA